MVAAGAEGFTLMEAIVALLLSTVVVFLVGTTFMVQSRYYSSQVLRSSTHDEVRQSTDQVATAVRSVMPGGVTVAGKRTLTVRTPMMLGAICSISGTTHFVYTDGGTSALDTTEVAGVARMHPTSGAWTYANANWSTLKVSTGNPPASCAASGADTAWVKTHYHALQNLATLLGVTPALGDVVMLFRQTTFRFKPSVLDPGSVALFRQRYGASEVEFTTHMDTTARFQYRTGGSSYSDTVTSANLSKIDVVRLVAESRQAAPTAAQEDVGFGWSVNVALRNIRGNE